MFLGTAIIVGIIVAILIIGSAVPLFRTNPTLILDTDKSRGVNVSSKEVITTVRDAHSKLHHGRLGGMGDKVTIKFLLYFANLLSSMSVIVTIFIYKLGIYIYSNVLFNHRLCVDNSFLMILSKSCGVAVSIFQDLMSSS